MSENKDRNVLPQQYILDLFDKTKDGKLAITYYPTNGEQPYDLTYDMDWTKERMSPTVIMDLHLQCFEFFYNGLI